jgi:DNA-binding transcriptional MerR regulator
MPRPEPSGRAPTEAGEQPGGDGADPHEPFLTVAAVARRLGIAPATLRTWDRRYGVGPTGHATGRHRRYAGQDVARLELMQRALVRGASAAEAARYALAETPAQERFDLIIGPRALRLPGAGRVAKGFARAVLAMDSVSAQRLLVDAIDASGVPRVWDEVIRPVLVALGRRRAGPGELDRLLHECVRSALIRATPLVTRPRNPRPVLLAGVSDEQHTLALYGLVAALAHRELGTRMLGAAVPADALAGAIRRTSPAAVVLWAHLPGHADPALVRTPSRARPRTRVFAAGPGWRALGLDPALVLPDGIGPAADDVENAVL